MLLLWRHPEIPTCEECQAWVYNDRWQKDTRGGQPIPRPKGAGTPCWTCPKARDGRPNPAAELTARNWRAWQAYLEYKAGRPVPRDPVVWRNNALCKYAEELYQRSQAGEAPRLLLRALAVIGSRS